MFLIYVLEVPNFGYHMLIRARSEIGRKSCVFVIFDQKLLKGRSEIGRKPCVFDIFA